MKEDVEKFLVKGLGKKEVVELAERAASDAVFFDALIDHIKSGKKTPAMKASWVLQNASEINRDFATDRASLFLSLLKDERVGGVQRELLKILGHIKWSDELEGAYIDMCFQFLNSPTADLGAKYHCIANIKSVLKKYPELKQELIVSIEPQLELYTDAWKRYATKFLLSLQK